MIKISLDEAYVFDLLAICKVKIKNLSGFKLDQTKIFHDNMIEEIKNQIGIEKFDKITQGQIFRNLIDSNQKVFDLVDECRQSDGLAFETDKANLVRYQLKKQLQNVFFDSELTESKSI